MESELEVFEKNVKAVFEDMTALLVSKRRSYGPSNLLEDGGYGILIRASDKIGRLRTMYKSESYESDDGDSLFDAWRDLIGYSVLAILMETEEYFKREEERKENPPPGQSYVKIVRPGFVGSDTLTIGEPSLPNFDFHSGVNPKISVANVVNQWERKIALAMLSAYGQPAPSPEVFDLTGWEGAVSFGGDSEVEVNGVPMTNEQFTAVLEGMNFSPVTQPLDDGPTEASDAATQESAAGVYVAPGEGEAFNAIHCRHCGRRAFSIDDLPYECLGRGQIVEFDVEVV